MIGELRPKYSEEQLSGTLSICHAIPVIYRFLEERYVDDFLTTGRLQISTIKHCRILEDERRVDKNESVYRYELQWADGTTNVIDAQVGNNAFVLCGSLTQSAVHDRACSYCIEFHHWERLVVEVGEQLRRMGFPICEIYSGPCNYSIKKRQIDMCPLKLEDVKTRNGEFDCKKIDAVLAGLGREAFYTTKDLQFVGESEYRILWLSNEEVPESPVIVDIPNPKRFGAKVLAIGETYER